MGDPDLDDSALSRAGDRALRAARLDAGRGSSAPLAILGLTIVHAFFWTDLRMRAPIVPAIALVAAGCVDLVRRRATIAAAVLHASRSATSHRRHVMTIASASARLRSAPIPSCVGSDRRANTSQRAMEKLMPVAATIPTTAAASRWRSKNSIRDGR